jgi:putative phosphoesterase
MRIGVVSDTHGQTRSAREAVRLLEALDVELVLHCGDIGAPEIVRLFDCWTTHFVLGNVDGDAGALERAAAEAGHVLHGAFGELELAGRRIALLHGDDERRLRQVIASDEYDLVCHGHTHVPRQERVGRTLVLNPGALHRATPHTLAVVELPGLEVTSVRV